ncbi:MAG: hypothetical protein J6Y02_17595 [Pseudobutyrivibrio sp.]|nr:hypothetical protein [Pseudobutyrivibrio sp.]
MGNITVLKQGSLNGLLRQTNECLVNAYNKGYQDGKNEPREVEEVNVEDTSDYRIGYKVGYEDGKKQAISEIPEIANKENEMYNEGLENAWKYINKLYQYGLNELQNYFDKTSIPDIICRTSITDIIASINLYEEKKQVEKEIKVGDEIQFDNEAKGVVISINKGWYRIVNESGFVNSWTRNDIKKTGRNFSAEVSQLLDKLKGDKE